MGSTRTSAVAMMAAAVVAVAAATGCSGGNNATSPSTASSTSTAASGTSSAEPSPSMFAPPGDYTGLLINASDIGPNITSPGPPKIDPNGPGKTGVAQHFTNSDGSLILDDVITVLIDPASAAQLAARYKTEVSKASPILVPQPIDVGTNGLMNERYIGSGAGKRLIIDLAFAEGNASVYLLSNSTVNDPIPLDVMLDIARKQDAAIKNGLPS